MAKPKLVKTKMDDLMGELIKKSYQRVLQNGLLTVQIENRIILKEVYSRLRNFEDQV